MSFLKDLFKTKEQKEQELTERAEAMMKLKLREEQEMREEILRQERKSKMESSIPWFERNLGNEDENAPVSVRFNWNQAFIQDLKNKNYVGDTEDSLVEDYLKKQSENEAKRLVELERDEKRKSSEPWVEVIGEKMDKEGLIELQLDWNDAFIKYLRQHGFRGATDDVIVQQWLISLDRSMEGSEYQ